MEYLTGFIIGVCVGALIVGIFNFAKYADVEELTHDDETMMKVYNSMQSMDLEDDVITDVVSRMQSKGILFRERLRE